MYVKTVQEFVAKDGKCFRTQQSCANYEYDLKVVEAIMNLLPNNTLQGKEYIQHDAARLLQIKDYMWQLVLEKYDKEFPGWKFIMPTGKDVGEGVAKFLINNSDGPIEQAWVRLLRFNFENGREYSNHYYAEHPEEATVERKRSNCLDDSIRQHQKNISFVY